VFTACNNDDDETITAVVTLPTLTAGSADFSNYVALGDSNTSGMTDGALFVAGQQNSFPNLLSQKFALAGGGSFKQPLMNDNTGGLLLGGNQIAPNRLVTTGGAPLSLEDVIGPVTPTTDLLLNNPTGPFNNMGIPLAKSFHLLAPGYGDLNGLFVDPATANPYYVRMTGAAPDATVLELAMAQNPSFFSLWIGSNDALGYATSGGDGSSPLTDPAFFDTVYNGLVATLTSGGAQGVLVNVPYIENAPFFTAVKYDALDPEENAAYADQIPLLNTIFGALNQIYVALGQTDRVIVFSETEASAVVIKDENLADLSATITGALMANPGFPAFIAQFGLPPAAAPLVANLLGSTYGQARQATEHDFLLLTSGGVIGEVNVDNYTQLVLAGVPAETAGQLSVNGLTFPLQDKWVLLEEERIELFVAVDAYNVTIQNAASAAGVAFVDAKSIVQEIAETGYANGDFILTNDLVTGGAFSLDGLHGTAKGNVIIANEIMKAIDATYGSNFEAADTLMDVGNYPSNYSPLLP
jgi:hypothetical protein